MNETAGTLSIHQAAQLLLATPQLLRNELSALPPAVLTWRPAPGEWCINEVIGHIIEADRHGFDGRIRAILASGSAGQPLSAWDIAGAVARRRDAEADGLALVEDLAARRARSAALIVQLQPADLQRYGVHPLVGELRVTDVLHEWLHHDMRHAKQILSNVEAYVWPHLGNAQRFSEIYSTGSS